MHQLAVQSLTVLFFLVLNLTVPGYGVGLPTSLRVILKYHCIYSLSSTPSSPSTRLSHRLDQFIDLCFHFPRQVYPTINSTNLSLPWLHILWDYLKHAMLPQATIWKVSFCLVKANQHCIRSPKDQHTSNTFWDYHAINILIRKSIHLHHMQQHTMM